MLVLSLVLIPFLGSALAAVLPQRARNSEFWLAAGVCVYALVATASLYNEVAAGAVLREEFASLPAQGLDFVLRVDGLAWVFAMLVLAIGLLVVVVLRAQAAAAVLLAVLAAVVLLGFRAYGQLSRRHATLNEVHAFTQQVAEAPDGRELADVLLRNAARLLNAEAATLRLLDSGPGGAPGVLRLTGDGRVEPVPPAQAGLRADDGVRPDRHVAA